MMGLLHWWEEGWTGKAMWKIHLTQKNLDLNSFPETKNKTTKNPTEHTYTQIKIPVMKLFKEQYSEEMILIHLSENTLNNQTML